MLVELGVVEQRLNAVREVLEGATVVDVARRNGVARQTVHEWLRKYANGGLGALVDRSSKPDRCAHQMPVGWRHGSSSCAGLIRRGDRGRSCIGWRATGSSRCRVVRRCIEHCCVTA